MKLNRDLVKRVLPILEAFNEGKEIQFQYSENYDWTGIDDIAFEALAEFPEKYRIKPKAEYRPFKSAREYLEEMEKHSAGAWYKPATTNTRYFQAVEIGNHGFTDSNRNYITYETAVKEYYFLDGSRLGIKV